MLPKAPKSSQAIFTKELLDKFITSRPQGVSHKSIESYHYKVSAPKTPKKLLPAITEEQLQTLLKHCHCERDKAMLNLLWYSGMRLSEAANVGASDFNWEGGTVVVLGKGNKYRKALAGNGVVREWFSRHAALEVLRGGNR
jgi:integrase